MKTSQTKIKYNIIRMFFMVLLFITVYPTISFADLPLAIEELLTKKRTWKYEFGINYLNVSGEDSIPTYGYVVAVVGNQIVPVKTVSDVDSVVNNRDILVISNTLRYGLGTDTEIYSRLTGTIRNERVFFDKKSSTEKDERFNSIFLGINYRLSKDNKTPAFLLNGGFYPIENVAKEKDDYIHFKSFSLGFTTYRSIDPIVLSFVSSYFHYLKREVDDIGETPSGILLLNPNLYFAANDSITITMGLQWMRQSRKEIDDKKQGIISTTTKIQFGIGYSWSDKLTLYFDNRFDVSGNRGSETTFNIIYKFSDSFKK